MDLFSNVNNTQKSTDYSMAKSNDTLQSRKLEDTANIQKDKQQEEVVQHKKKITKDELQDLTAKLNKEMGPLNPDIKFQFDNDSDILTVNVVDKKTEKIIRKFPSDEALRIMEKMRELVGALFDDKG